MKREYVANARRVTWMKLKSMKSITSDTAQSSAENCISLFQCNRAHCHAGQHSAEPDPALKEYRVDPFRSKNEQA